MKLAERLADEIARKAVEIKEPLALQKHYRLALRKLDEALEEAAKHFAKQHTGGLVSLMWVAEQLREMKSRP